MLLYEIMAPKAKPKRSTFFITKDVIRIVGEKIMDVGNLIFAGLVLGQIVAEKGKPSVMLLGAIAFFTTYLIAMYIMIRK